MAKFFIEGVKAALLYEADRIKPYINLLKEGYFDTGKGYIISSVENRVLLQTLKIALNDIIDSSDKIIEKMSQSIDSRSSKTGDKNG